MNWFTQHGQRAWEVSVGTLRRLVQWQRVLFSKGTTLAAQVWDGTKRESRETQEAVGILARMLRGEAVSDTEKKFFKEQAKDLARLLPLVALQGIPVPIPFVPLLVLLGKRYGFQVLPTDQQALLDEMRAQEAALLPPVLEETTVEPQSELSADVPPPPPPASPG